ncbi:hypothetical protein [Pseudomonas sp. Irchel 3H7]|uniref:hypothetical protein n=1 Tax=Pseudomonas sp. Irchel 3H7 TaxID=2009042 RepID=UPI000BA2FA4E|nr:hypothetical protein [Pseudomonas sp. Irchel 3H7]
MTIDNDIDISKHLAIKQMVHFIHLKKSAIAVGDKVGVRRATDVIDRLTTEYGLSALHEAQEQYK